MKQEPPAAAIKPSSNTLVTINFDASEKSQISYEEFSENLSEDGEEEITQNFFGAHTDF